MRLIIFINLLYNQPRASIPMSEPKKIRGITIFEDYFFYNYEKIHHQPIKELPLSKFADIALRWSNYGDYLLRTHQLSLIKSENHDGFPLQDFYIISYDGKNNILDSRKPLINISFYETSNRDVNYNYVAMASRSTTTAYKRGRTGQPCEVKFKIYSASIKRDEGEADIWIQGELIRLQGIFDNLDKATQSLHLWAENGLNMRVFCASHSCRALNPAIIPNNQLLAHANNGLSLDDLKRRLKCKICGAHCSHVQAA